MSCEIQLARHNHQPTHQQGTKWAGKAWPKMTKNANSRQNCAVLGQKKLIFTVESESFGTHITKKPPEHIVCIVFWSGMGQNWPKLPIFGPKWPRKKTYSWVNLVVPKNWVAYFSAISGRKFDLTTVLRSCWLIEWRKRGFIASGSFFSLFLTFAPEKNHFPVVKSGFWGHISH